MLHRTKETGSGSWAPAEEEKRNGRRDPEDPSRHGEADRRADRPLRGGGGGDEQAAEQEHRAGEPVRRDRHPRGQGAAGLRRADRRRVAEAGARRDPERGRVLRSQGVRQPSSRRAGLDNRPRLIDPSGEGPSLPGGSSQAEVAMARLEGRTALVTGASRGLGRAIALKLAEDGAKVAINYRTGEQQAREVADQISAGGGTVLLLRGDV